MIVAHRVTQGQLDASDFVVFITYLAQVGQFYYHFLSWKPTNSLAVYAAQSTRVHLSVCEPIFDRHRKVTCTVERTD